MRELNPIYGPAVYGQVKPWVLSLGKKLAIFCEINDYNQIVGMILNKQHLCRKSMPKKTITQVLPIATLA